MTLIIVFLGGMALFYLFERDKRYKRENQTKKEDSFYHQEKSTKKFSYSPPSENKIIAEDETLFKKKDKFPKKKPPFQKTPSPYKAKESLLDNTDTFSFSFSSPTKKTLSKRERILEKLQKEISFSIKNNSKLNEVIKELCLEAELPFDNSPHYPAQLMLSQVKAAVFYNIEVHQVFHKILSNKKSGFYVTKEGKIHLCSFKSSHYRSLVHQIRKEKIREQERKLENRQFIYELKNYLLEQEEKYQLWCQRYRNLKTNYSYNHFTSKMLRRELSEFVKFFSFLYSQCSQLVYPHTSLQEKYLFERFRYNIKKYYDKKKDFYIPLIKRVPQQQRAQGFQKANSSYYSNYYSNTLYQYYFSTVRSITKMERSSKGDFFQRAIANLEEIASLGKKDHKQRQDLLTGQRQENPRLKNNSSYPYDATSKRKKYGLSLQKRKSIFKVIMKALDNEEIAKRRYFEQAAKVGGNTKLSTYGYQKICFRSIAKTFKIKESVVRSIYLEGVNCRWEG